MNPHISICIPCYKAKEFIGEALASIQAQTFSDWELILVEDGLDDGTEQLVKSVTADWVQPVYYVKHATNQGLSRARNTANENASGEWVAILDADDVWKPKHLENLVKMGDAEDLDLVFSGSEIFHEGSRETIGYRPAPDGIVADLGRQVYLGALVIQPSSAMIRRTVFDRIGPFDLSTDCNDFEYWLRMGKHLMRAGGCSEYTCLYRKHEKAMSNDSAKLLDEVSRICFKYRNSFDLNYFEKGLAARHAFNASRIARGNDLGYAIRLFLRGICYFIFR